ncbi:protein phosphatase 1F-like [Actinia tenebrosa]|uniref:Protein phosphatase 1E n=1 Tax=Actinia tenebrosa TaxID=6105 RepID=A0A6P8HA97_ACTTE|nr:protein phosphatase 1F-like [Actinia tenebrosa]
MGVEFTEEEKQKAADFLSKFALEHASPEEKDSLPFRVDAPHSIGSEEIHGYVIEWALEYLRKCNCPDDLAATITHHATQELLEADLTCYKLQNNKGLDVDKLVKATFNKVQEICVDWSHAPPKMFKSERSYQSCVHAIKNTRRKMEDKHIIMPYFSTLFGLPKEFPSLAFFAVYDGHGGVDAANYASANLHVFLSMNENLHTDPGLALYETFMMTDECFGLKARTEGLKSGCTAVTVLISNDTLHVAWLGDSQAVLSKGGEAVILMEPHKPDQKDEKDRIEALGGCVVYFGAWRVNGNLSVSRAIGDVEHKPYISGEPCLSEFTLEGDEEFVVLACDGLWDTVGREEVVKLVNAHVAEGNDRGTAAKLLVDTAKRAGSSDNISVIVVFLDAHSKTNSSKDISNPVIVRNHSQTPSHNGTTKPSNSKVNNETANSNQEQNDIEKLGVSEVVDQLVPIIAKVKISTETTETITTPTMTCKITCKEDKSYNNSGQLAQITKKLSLEQQTRSAESSPKQDKKTKTKSITPVGKASPKTKPKASSHLDVDQKASLRRRSAPGAFTSS